MFYIFLFTLAQAAEVPEPQTSVFVPEPNVLLQPSAVKSKTKADSQPLSTTDMPVQTIELDQGQLDIVPPLAP